MSSQRLHPHVFRFSMHFTVGLSPHGAISMEVEDLCRTLNRGGRQRAVRRSGGRGTMRTRGGWTMDEGDMKSEEKRMMKSNEEREDDEDEHNNPVFSTSFTL